MKSLVAFILASIPGMLIGVVLWTAFAMCIVAVYWVGFVFFYVGFICGDHKFGLALFVPPSPETQATAHECVFFFTVFAFTWLEVLAAAIGAFFGGAAGVAMTRLFSFVRRTVFRQRGERIEQAKKTESAPVSDSGK